MRFAFARDYATIVKINKELINTVIDTPVVIYKVDVSRTKTNLYGEGTNKSYFKGVIVSCLIDRKDSSPEDVHAGKGILDMQQRIEFAFLRSTLEEKNTYVEMGDVIEFDSQYYDVNNTNEIQLWAGQIAYDHQIRCDATLMRVAPTQLEKPSL